MIKSDELNEVKLEIKFPLEMISYPIESSDLESENFFRKSIILKGLLSDFFERAVSLTDPMVAIERTIVQSLLDYSLNPFHYFSSFFNTYSISISPQLLLDILLDIEADYLQQSILIQRKNIKLSNSAEGKKATEKNVAEKDATEEKEEVQKDNVQGKKEVEKAQLGKVKAILEKINQLKINVKMDQKNIAWYTLFGNGDEESKIIQEKFKLRLLKEKYFELQNTPIKQLSVQDRTAFAQITNEIEQRIKINLLLSFIVLYFFEVMYAQVGIDYEFISENEVYVILRDFYKLLNLKNKITEIQTALELLLNQITSEEQASSLKTLKEYCLKMFNNGLKIPIDLKSAICICRYIPLNDYQPLIVGLKILISEIAIEDNHEQIQSVYQQKCKESYCWNFFGCKPKLKHQDVIQEGELVTLTANP